jgi:hypothetical protein
LQAGGHRFDPDTLHFPQQHLSLARTIERARSGALDLRV